MLEKSKKAEELIKKTETLFGKEGFIIENGMVRYYPYPPEVEEVKFTPDGVDITFSLLLLKQGEQKVKNYLPKMKKHFGEENIIEKTNFVVDSDWDIFQLEEKILTIRMMEEKYQPPFTVKEFLLDLNEPRRKKFAASESQLPPKLKKWVVVYNHSSDMLGWEWRIKEED